MSIINHSFKDKLILQFDTAVRTIFAVKPQVNRENPANNYPAAELSNEERRQVSGLMRVNHVGEVCAQALYQGQALTARDGEVKEKLKQSAIEEKEHLAWCQERIQALDSHTSYLNMIWYSCSFFFGMVAGVAGDKWNLAFLAETERQVVHHLQGHLEKLPSNDQQSKAILEQMVEDESYHATVAVTAGAAELPDFIKAMMSFTSKIMTKTAYWI